MGKKNIKRISYEDRKTIEMLMNAGWRIVDIATIVGVHRATIYKELKRCAPYQAEIAQRLK